RLLARRGHQVERAGSVAQAIEVANHSEFDLIISDLGLPDGSGRDLMLALQEKSHVPAIALSGYGMKSDIEESKAAGFDEHFTKPVDISQLEDAIDKVLRVGSCVLRVVRLKLFFIWLILAMPVVGQLPEAMDPATRPKTWFADLQMMMRHGRMEPAMQETLVKIHQFAKRGRLVRITKQHQYSAFSTSRGILAFRRGISEDPERVKEVWYDGIVIGIHASKHDPPSLPFHVESRIGGVPLLARKVDTPLAMNPLVV